MEKSTPACRHPRQQPCPPPSNGHPRQRGTTMRRQPLYSAACVALPRWRGCRQAGVDFSTLHFQLLVLSSLCCVIPTARSGGICSLTQGRA
ncbi:MAG: hypothetical protein LBF19_04655, partial [Prevotellaceae bacterium]|nr:hypothetical protein [Prevotellaceae bacterium]